jgi:bifunctional non-homologous end joining protein LigD
MGVSKDEAPEVLSLSGREVLVTHPSKLYFSKQARLTKLELVRYYVSVAEGALAGIRGRPLVLKRFVNGAEGEPFYQKRAPDKRPEWLRTVTLSFPSGRTAEEIVVDDAAGLAWVVNLGCIELHPHPVLGSDLEHPDELRIDLDPGPGVDFADVRRVALEVRLLLEELGLSGFPKTSGSRGMHVNVRIEQRWSFSEVRRAALALSREIERRAPSLATSKWWKEERHGVFLDYNQNAKDRTTCSAYSVRPLPDARVSAPLTWDEVPDVDPAEFTVQSMPARFAAIGHPHAKMDEHPGSLDKLLELADRDEARGLADAPWPPHFKKAGGEAPRVAPSRARSGKTRRAPARARASVGGEASERARAVALEGAVGLEGARGHGEPRGDGELRGDAGEAGARAPGGAAKSKRRGAAREPRPDGEPRGDAGEPGATAPGAERGSAAKGKRRSSMPLIVVANSPDKQAALAGLERWRARHASAARHLAVDDILVDSMRGRSSTWTRIRINLRHVPPESRPAPETPDPDDDPTRQWRQRKIKPEGA